MRLLDFEFRIPDLALVADLNELHFGQKLLVPGFRLFGCKSIRSASMAPRTGIVFTSNLAFSRAALAFSIVCACDIARNSSSAFIFRILASS